MNKVITLVFASMLLIASSSQANPMHHRTHSHHHGAPNWIAPIVIGGVLGYALAQPRQVIVQPPAPVAVYPNTYPPVPYGYHYEQIVNAGCNCYRWVLVPN